MKITHSQTCAIICIYLLMPFISATSYSEELQAPNTSINIILSPTQTPTNVVLKNWYCLILDDKVDQLDVERRADDLTISAVKERVDGFADPFVKYAIYANHNWGYDPDGILSALMKSELKPSFVMKKLDVPQGETKVFHKKNCYTKSEINMFVLQVSNKVTERMQKILQKLRTPPYDFTQEQFSEAGWYTPPPKKYKTSSFSGHSINVSVKRQKKPDIQEPELPAPPPGAPPVPENKDVNKNPNFGECTFNGLWTSYLGDIHLQQSGSTLTGMADYDATKFEGKVQGKVMTGYWRRKPYTMLGGIKGGDFILTLSDDCQSYTGKWRHGAQEEGDDFYGWNNWPAKRPNALPSKPLEDVAATIPVFSPVNGAAQELILLQQQLDELNQASADLEEARSQWVVLSSYINEQRALGKDVRDLTRNLQKINLKKRKFRMRVVALNTLYGTLTEIQKKLDSQTENHEKIPKNDTDTDQKRSSTSNFDSNDFKIGYSIPSLPGFNKYLRDKKAKPDDKGTKISPPVQKPTPLITAYPGQITDPATSWTMYKLETLSRGTDSLPVMNAIKIELNSTSARSILSENAYPISVVKNDNGATLWSVNWQNGKTTYEQKAATPDRVKELEATAQKHKAGSVPKDQLDTLIGNTLGVGAQKIK